MYSYRPSPPPRITDPQSVLEWANREFQSIMRTLGQPTAFVQLEPQYVAPIKPRLGLIVYADGTLWNPGAGEGPYVYTSGGWVILTA